MQDNKPATNQKYSEVTDPEKLRRIEEKRQRNKQKMLDNRAKNKAKKEQGPEADEDQEAKEKRIQEMIRQGRENKKAKQEQKQQVQGEVMQEPKVEKKEKNKNSKIESNEQKRKQETKPQQQSTTGRQSITVPSVAIRRTNTTVHNLPEYDEMELQRVLEYRQNKQIHESFFKLGIKFKNESKMGKNRCISMLEAAQEMIKGVQLPQSEEWTQAQLLGEELRRHVAQLQGFFEYLGVVLDEGINSSLKLLSRLSTLLDETQQDLELCQQWLHEQISSFIRQKVENSQEEIIKLASALFNDGDVVLTFARSKLITKVMHRAKQNNTQFTVILVDNPPYFEGKQMAADLQALGIQVIYTLPGSIGKFLPKVSKAMVGGASVLMNGTLVGRVGTALVGAMAHSARIPFIVCCETYKFSSKSQLDSVAENQLRNPNKIMATKQEGVTALNLKWDLTPAHFIHMVVTELGKVPPTSVPVILREFERLFDLRKMESTLQG